MSSSSFAAAAAKRKSRATNTIDSFFGKKSKVTTTITSKSTPGGILCKRCPAGTPAFAPQGFATHDMMHTAQGHPIIWHAPLGTVKVRGPAYNSSQTQEIINVDNDGTNDNDSDDGGGKLPASDNNNGTEQKDKDDDNDTDTDKNNDSDDNSEALYDLFDVEKQSLHFAGDDSNDGWGNLPAANNNDDSTEHKEDQTNDDGKVVNQKKKLAKKKARSNNLTPRQVVQGLNLWYKYKEEVGDNKSGFCKKLKTHDEWKSPATIEPKQLRRWLKNEEEQRKSAKKNGSDRRKQVHREPMGKYPEMELRLAAVIRFMRSLGIPFESWMLAIEAKQIFHDLYPEVYPAPLLDGNDDDAYPLTFSNTWQKNFFKRNKFSFRKLGSKMNKKGQTVSNLVHLPKRVHSNLTLIAFVYLFLLFLSSRP